ncbi:hypothetical protein J4448_02380 [Candidatus Woesearchaeota archaeon]|nr:hypothetical protein [Candidatus Woesearchaeota archaeon]MBS3113923.1 hypothetical protein [Candidatus Woesearchaeota archaeon]
MNNIIGIALNSVNPDERVIRIAFPKEEENAIIDMLERTGIRVKRETYPY